MWCACNNIVTLTLHTITVTLQSTKVIQRLNDSKWHY